MLAADLVEVARGEGEAAAADHGEAALGEVLFQRGHGGAELRIGQHLAGPQQVEILLEARPGGVRRHHHREADVDLHRAQLGIDAGADEQRAQREGGRRLVGDDTFFRGVRR